MKTRIAILVFFNHYYFLTHLLSFACQEALSVFITTRGAKCLHALCSYQEVSLCLVSQVMLRSSTFASSIDKALLSPTSFTTSHICLSQAYGCSDHYSVGTLIFILSYLKARDPERILLYIDRGTFVF